MLQLLIAAADAGSQIEDYLPALSTVGSLGFAVWYAWYTTTVLIPRMLDAHRAERTEMQNRFDLQLRALVDEMRSQREYFIGMQK